MATIWRALDEQLDREVAVKLLRPQFSSDPGFAARFKQEARAAGGLSHPNIVGVYDYGTDGPDGDQYIVMELVRGRDLAAILRDRGPVSRDDAVRIGIGVADALEVAHRKGIVHRDVKPGNILITEGGDVKVTDFGIARAVSEASMTVTGTTLGSVHYFSPELARGDEVTGASDVYSRAIVLYEMLTGRRPFEADSAAAVALKRLSEDPASPSAIGVPLAAGLESIVMRGLARDPAERFPDAGAFAEALRVWRRNPDVVPPLAAGLAGAAVATTPPAGEPTVYVPPRVTRPADRIPVAPPPRRGDAYPRDRDEGQPWWMWLLAILSVFLLGAIGFLAVQLLGGLGAPTVTPSPSSAQVVVPDCEDVSLVALRSQLEDSVVLDERDEASEDIEEGRVIRCEPETGNPVDEGSTLIAFVSIGPEEVSVPRLRGQTLDQATATLQGAELAVGAVEREFDPEVPDGSVIRSNPAEGETAAPGDQVDLVISRGPTPSPSPSPTPTPTPTPTPSPTPTPTPVPETPAPG